jgi:hypothetical protein
MPIIFPLLFMVMVVPVAHPVPVSSEYVEVLVEETLILALIVSVTATGKAGEPAAVKML